MKKFLIEAVAGFVFWTGILTPYMVFIVGTNVEQYLKWVGMQLIIVPVLSPLSLMFMNWAVKILRKKSPETLQ